MVLHYSNIVQLPSFLYAGITIVPDDVSLNLLLSHSLLVMISIILGTGLLHFFFVCFSAEQKHRHGAGGSADLPLLRSSGRGVLTMDNGGRGPQSYYCAAVGVLKSAYHIGPVVVHLPGASPASWMPPLTP